MNSFALNSLIQTRIEAGGGDSDLKRMAEAIIADQSKELGRIQELLGSG